MIVAMIFKKKLFRGVASATDRNRCTWDSTSSVERHIQSVMGMACLLNKINDCHYFVACLVQTIWQFCQTCNIARVLYFSKIVQYRCYPDVNVSWSMDEDRIKFSSGLGHM